LNAYFCTVKQNLKSWLLLLLLACIWGSSFILMKKGMYTTSGEAIFSAPQVASLRILLAALVLFPFAIPSLKKLFHRKNAWRFLSVGLSGNLIPAFLFTYAETGISSGLAGMLNSFTPIFTLLVGVLLFQIKAKLFQVIGAVIGTVGIFLLVILGKSASFTGNMEQIIAVIIATLLYGLSLNLIKHKLAGFTSLEITSLSFASILIPSAFAFFYFQTPAVMFTNPAAGPAFLYISILGIIGTAMAVFLFNGIIKKSSALFASSVTYLIPIVAVLIGLSFSEEITYNQVGAMVIVLLGVFIVNYGQLVFLKMKELLK
jgi:drug/metabolite transporter (DMT)-like permease